MRKKVLVVDNDILYTKPLLDRLLMEEYEVTYAQAVDEALEAVEQDLDVVILDLMMPRGPYGPHESDNGSKTGILLARDFARRKPDLPVIVLTVRDDESIKHEAWKVPNVKGYRIKPVLPSVVVEEIRSLLGEGGTK